MTDDRSAVGDEGPDGDDAHARYEELTAGYALSALEPGDEQDLLQHLPTCPQCRRDLAVHEETLAHLAYAGEAVTPPASLWEGIKAEVLAGSPDAFTAGPPAAAPELAPLAAVPAARGSAGPARPVAQPVDELAARRGRRQRWAAWTSVAAAVALVGGLAGWGVAQRRDDGPGSSRQLAAAVRALEQGPGTTVPLAGADGRVRLVAVLQDGRVSVMSDGLTPNDTSDSVYVLWGKSGTASPPQALAAFDVGSDDVEVVRDLRLPSAAPSPDLLLLTKEPGRVAPTVPATAAIASGRTA